MILGTSNEWFRLTALTCAVLLMPGEMRVFAQEQTPSQPATEAPKLKSGDQLDHHRTIALYPDPLLAQVLAASTYPVEIVQAHRWLKANSNLTGEKLTKAAAKQAMGSKRTSPGRLPGGAQTSG